MKKKTIHDIPAALPWRKRRAMYDAIMADAPLSEIEDKADTQEDARIRGLVAWLSKKGGILG